MSEQPDDAIEEPMADGRRPRQADAAGAMLLVVGMLGGLAWAWMAVRGQFSDSRFNIEDSDSLGDRVDLIVEQAGFLLLAALVVGVGIGIRVLAGTSDGASGGSVFGRPLGRMLLGASAVLLLVVGGAAVERGRDDAESGASAWEDISMLAEEGDLDVPTIDLDALFDDDVYDDVYDDDVNGGDVQIFENGEVSPPEPELDDPPALTHTLEVHTDGCGVFRSGEIGEDLTWVVKDRDGFQVLARNAAGETQYRYYRPGTYTVELEAWSGGCYAPVSNVVAITC